LHHSELHSFPTRRSSDLKENRCHHDEHDGGIGGGGAEDQRAKEDQRSDYTQHHPLEQHRLKIVAEVPMTFAHATDQNKKRVKDEDRKSTRPNYSHVAISY